MARRFVFKPSLRDTQLANLRALEFMSGAAPNNRREEVAAFISQARASVKPAPRQRGVTLHCRVAQEGGAACASLENCKRGPLECRTSRATGSVQRDLEGPVVSAIGDLLAVHPKVLFAVRQNTGAASYEAKSGKYAPVFFYRLLTHSPKDITITDFWGILKAGRMLAVEAKAPGWHKVSTDRELRQEMFLMLVRNCGGVALFATSAEQVAEALR